MRNAISRWTAGIGCCLLALAPLGCGSSESGSAVTQTDGPAAEDHGDHGDHVHGEGHHGHGEDAHEHEGHGHAAHEGHSHGEAGSGNPPADFASAVVELQGLYQTIKSGFQSGDTDEADAALHQVGHLLEVLPELAGKAGLGEQELASVKSASSSMFEVYGKIDEAVHSSEDPDYQAVADKLDKAMAELSKLAKPAAPGNR